ncbi:MAG: hypothetical protein KF760_22070 [Candidatus Eremiobacteraeota bacterium]|nr:hypothetical protein [Candidatus Eremiobacteraeota bacterium]MCW5866560.1 hypothetical protein [Candidatus Eremiobacteraeota bacterium]
MIEYEVVKILYLEALESADKNEEAVKLRLEVLRHCSDGGFRVKVFRAETYKLLPATGPDELWGKEILIADGHANWSAIAGHSVEEVVQKVLEHLPYS